MNSKWMLPAALCFLVLASCKKNSGSNDDQGNPPTVDKVKDSALWIAQEIYLWNTQIPSGFNAQQYADPDKIMTAIRTYSKEPGFTGSVDRWSFAYDQAAWDDVSGGVAQDFGFSVYFRAEGDLRIKYVEKASPAGQAGLKRGWRITSINGNTNITTTNADFIVDKVFYSASTNFRFQKPDGNSVDVTLNAGTYQENPFLLDSVYTAGAAKAGYIVFNSFLGDTSAIYTKMNSVFDRFSNEGVTDVIVDLRYNGGGYVSVQQKFANYLVNNAGNGGVMMSEQFNSDYASLYNSTDHFTKLGNLNIDRVIFIVSDNTASASELLINNLKPYLNVKIVGPSSSYGKPVGYFPIPAGNWYVFPVSFRSTNKNGEGNYFDGFAPDKIVADGLDKDWGDRNEACLSSVLTYLGTGSFGLNRDTEINGAATAKTAAVKSANLKLAERQFKGAVDTRRLELRK